MDHSSQNFRADNLHPSHKLFLSASDSLGSCDTTTSRLDDNQHAVIETKILCVYKQDKQIDSTKDNVSFYFLLALIKHYHLAKNTT